MKLVPTPIYRLCTHNLFFGKRFKLKKMFQPGFSTIQIQILSLVNRIENDSLRKNVVNLKTLVVKLTFARKNENVTTKNYAKQFPIVRHKTQLLRSKRLWKNIDLLRTVIWYLKTLRDTLDYAKKSYPSNLLIAMSAIKRTGLLPARQRLELQNLPTDDRHLQLLLFVYCPTPSTPLLARNRPSTVFTGRSVWWIESVCPNHFGRDEQSELYSLSCSSAPSNKRKSGRWSTTDKSARLYWSRPPLNITWQW